MAIEKLNKTYINGQTKLNATDFQENVDKIDEIIEIQNDKGIIKVFESDNGALDVNLENFGFGLFLIQLESSNNGPSGLYLYQSNSVEQIDANIGFGYVYNDLLVNVKCNKQYPALLQPQGNDGSFRKICKIYKIIL